MRDAVVAFPDYSFYPTDRLLEAFREAPARLRAAIAGLDAAELRARPRGPLSWSAHEIVLHVADSELVGAFRVRKVLAEPGSVLPGYDQDAWARQLDYSGQDDAARETALELFARLRDRIAPRLAVADDVDWEKRGLHPEYGPVTLRNLLELYADHGERHVEQILAIRQRLGRPLALESRLPRRLY